MSFRKVGLELQSCFVEGYCCIEVALVFEGIAEVIESIWVVGFESYCFFE